MSWTTFSVTSEGVRDRTVRCERCEQTYLIVDRVYDTGTAQQYNGLFTNANRTLTKAHHNVNSKLARRSRRLGLDHQRCPTCGFYCKRDVEILIAEYRRMRGAAREAVLLAILFSLVLVFTVILPPVLLWAASRKAKGLRRKAITPLDINNPEVAEEWVLTWAMQSPEHLHTLQVDQDVSRRIAAYSRLQALRHRYDFPEPTWRLPCNLVPAAATEELLSTETIVANLLRQLNSLK